MTSKQRAYLKGLAMTMDPIFQIGKSSLTPENTKAIDEALEARELIKISVLQNCLDDPKEIAAGCGRAHTFPGGSGHRQKDRPVPGRQKREKENHSPVKGVTEKW